MGVVGWGFVDEADEEGEGGVADEEEDEEGVEDEKILEAERGVGLSALRRIVLVLLGLLLK